MSGLRKKGDSGRSAAVDGIEAIAAGMPVPDTKRSREGRAAQEKSADAALRSIRSVFVSCPPRLCSLITPPSLYDSAENPHAPIDPAASPSSPLRRSMWDVLAEIAEGDRARWGEPGIFAARCAAYLAVIRSAMGRDQFLEAAVVDMWEADRSSVASALLVAGVRSEKARLMLLRPDIDRRIFSVAESVLKAIQDNFSKAVTIIDEDTGEVTGIDLRSAERISRIIQNLGTAMDRVMPAKPYGDFRAQDAASESIGAFGTEDAGEGVGRAYANGGTKDRRLNFENVDTDTLRELLNLNRTRKVVLRDRTSGREIVIEGNGSRVGHASDSESGSCGSCGSSDNLIEDSDSFGGGAR